MELSVMVLRRAPAEYVAVARVLRVLDQTVMEIVPSRAMKEQIIVWDLAKGGRKSG